MLKWKMRGDMSTPCDSNRYTNISCNFSEKMNNTGKTPAICSREVDQTPRRIAALATNQLPITIKRLTMQHNKGPDNELTLILFK